VGLPTCQAYTLDVKLPGREVLKPGKTVRTTDPADALESGVSAGLAPVLGALVSGAAPRASARRKERRGAGGAAV